MESKTNQTSRPTGQEADELSPLSWERQPWETAKAFDAFQRFYLPLPLKERTVVNAYKAYAADKGLALRLQKSKGSIFVPGGFKCWSAGIDRHGKRPPGSKTWEQRAKERDTARDRALAEELDAEWRERQKELRRQEWEQGQKMLDRAETMWTQFQPDSTEWTEGDVVRMIDAGLKLKRRAAGLPEKNVEITRDWRKEMVGMGLNPDEFLEWFAGLLAPGAGGEADAKPTGEAV